MSRINVMKPWLGAEEADTVAEVIISSWDALGPRVAAFEAAFAEAMRFEHAVATSNCTTALHLALVVAGVRHGDDVVVPSFSFIATTHPPTYVGDAPLAVADVDPLASNVKAEPIGRALTGKTTAVIFDDQGGAPVDIDSVWEMCDPRGIILMEDAACESGSTGKGCPFGVGAGVGAWSVHPRRLLVTGGGGTLTPRNEERATRVRQLREHSMNVWAKNRADSVLAPAEEYLEVGYHYRMTDLQAAIGIVQLGRVNEIVARRREIVAINTPRLSQIPGLRPVRDPAWGEGIFQSIWVDIAPGLGATRGEVLGAGALADSSAHRGIMSSDRQPVYRGIDTEVASLAFCERLSDNTLILPVLHQMTDEEQSRVIGAACSGSGGPGRPMVLVILVAETGLAREVAAAIADHETRLVISSLDDGTAKPVSTIDGIEVFGAIGDVVVFPTEHPLVCVGHRAAGQRIVAQLGALSVGSARYATVVDRTARVIGSSSVGRGNARLAGVVMTASASIGAHVAAIPGLVLSHDDAVAECATFVARVALGANVPVGRAAHLSRNASARALSAIGWGVTIGMAAAVLGDIPDAEARVSVPVQPIERTG